MEAARSGQSPPQLSHQGSSQQDGEGAGQNCDITVLSEAVPELSHTDAGSIQSQASSTTLDQHVVSAPTSQTTTVGWRAELLCAMLDFLALKTEHPNYPQLAGPLAERCITTAQQGYSLDTVMHTAIPDSAPWVDYKQIADCDEITVVTATPSQAESLDSVLCRFLVHTPPEEAGIECTATHDSSGCRNYIYTCNEQHIMTIRVLTRPRTPVEIPPMQFQMVSAPNKRPHLLRVAPCALLLDLWTRVVTHQPAPEELFWIGQQLDKLSIIMDTDVFLYNSIVQRYNAFFYFTAVPIPAPPRSLEPTPVTPLSQGVAQPSPQLPRITVKPQLIIANPHFRSALFNLRKDPKESISKDHLHICELFEPIKGQEKKVPGRPHVSGKRTKKETKTGRRLHQGSLLEFVQSLNTPKGRAQHEADTRADIARWTKSIRVQSETREKRVNAFTPLFTPEIACKLEHLISSEHLARQIPHTFPDCPYLGPASCTYAARQPASQYPDIAKHISTLINGMFTCLAQNPPSEANAGPCYTTIATLLLKYPQYLDGDTSALPPLLKQVAQAIRRMAQQRMSPEGVQIQNHDLRILPHALFVLLQETARSGTPLPQETVETIMGAMIDLLNVSQIHGAYDLAAAVIVQLSTHAKYLILPEAHPLHSQIAHLLFQLVGTLKLMVEDSFDGSHEQVNTSQVLRDLKDQIEALPEQQKQVPGQQKWLQKTMKSANRVYEKDRLVQRAMEKEIRAQAKAEADARQKAKRELQLAMQLARSSKTPPSSQQGSQTDQETEEETTTCSLETAPVRNTAPDHIRVQQAPWEKTLRACQVKIHNGDIETAKRERDSVLMRVQTDIQRARIWAECGDAFLECQRPSLSALNYVSNACHKFKSTLIELQARAKKDFPNNPPSKDCATQWLPHNFPAQGNLAKLVERFPSEDTIIEMAQAIQTAVDHYNRALDQLGKCSSHSLQTMGCYLIELMEADLKKLHEKREQIMEARANLCQVMSLRLQVLKILGLYGCSPNYSQDKVAKKSWIRTAAERFKDTAGEPAGLYPTNPKGEDLLTKLMARIEHLRRTQERQE